MAKECDDDVKYSASVKSEAIATMAAMTKCPDCNNKKNY